MVDLVVVVADALVRELCVSGGLVPAAGAQDLFDVGVQALARVGPGPCGPCRVGHRVGATAGVGGRHFVGGCWWLLVKRAVKGVSYYS